MNKTKLYLILISLFISSLSHAAPPGSGWGNPKFSDEFNGNQLNTNKWFARTNGVFKRDHVGVGGGVLKLRNTYANNGTIGGGWITSKQKFAGQGNIKYGYYEARLRITGNPNGAIWPTWWIWGNRVNNVTTTEIDVMEYSGFSKRWFNNRATSSHHYRGKRKINGSSQTTTSANSALARNAFQWHTWGVLWTPNELSFWYDGKKYMSSAQPGDAAAENNPLGLIFSTSPHTINADPEQPDNPVAANAAKRGQNLPSLEVDWVRVWTGGNPGGGNPGPGPGPGNPGGGGDVTPPSGFTNLQVRHSSKCFDVAAGLTANGTTYHQWACNTGNANQRFQFVSRGNGVYGIKSQRSNRCVDIENGSSANGAKIQQYDCWNGNQNQSWKLVSKGGGWFEIQSQKTGKCLDVSGVSSANGAKFHQWECVNGNNQQFKFLN